MKRKCAQCGKYGHFKNKCPDLQNDYLLRKDSPYCPEVQKGAAGPSGANR